MALVPLRVRPWQSLKYGLGLVDSNSSIELLLVLNWAGFNKNWKNGVWLRNALNDLAI